MTLSVRSPDELIAVIPHLLGFKPEESLVFLPMSSELPTARVDLPTTPPDREVVWDSIRDAYSRHRFGSDAPTSPLWPAKTGTAPRHDGSTSGHRRPRRPSGDALRE